jgi:hypothetical protein
MLDIQIKSLHEASGVTSASVSSLNERGPRHSERGASDRFLVEGDCAEGGSVSLVLGPGFDMGGDQGPQLPELDARPQVVERLLAEPTRGRVTLLCGDRKTEYIPAAAMREHVLPMSMRFAG